MLSINDPNIEEHSKEPEDIAIRNFGTISNTSFEFWNNPKEDIYQDYLN